MLLDKIQPLLEQFLDDIEVLKLEPRLFRDIHIVAVKHYAEVFAGIDFMARQISWWKKSNT
jgi:hypothetical protein